MIKLGIFILPNYSIKRKILNKKRYKKTFWKAKIFVTHTSLHCLLIYISEN